MKNTQTKSRFTCSWNIAKCMANAKIPSVRSLHNAMKKANPDTISYGQLAVLVKEGPLKICLKTLSTMCFVMQCQISDILVPVFGEKGNQ